jgi:hypothetical protein
MSYIELKIIGKRSESGVGERGGVVVWVGNLDELLRIDVSRYEYLGRGDRSVLSRVFLTVIVGLVDAVFDASVAFVVVVETLGKLEIVVECGKTVEKLEERTFADLYEAKENEGEASDHRSQKDEPQEIDFKERLVV